MRSRNFVVVRDDKCFDPFDQTLALWIHLWGLNVIAANVISTRSTLTSARYLTQ